MHDSKEKKRPPYRIPETARRLGVSEALVRKAIRRREIEAFRFGRLWLIRPESVDRLLNGEVA